MRKVSWMAIIVVLGGGFLGVTRFAGMWGRSDDGSQAPTSEWQFERPGEEARLDTTDGGLRTLPSYRSALDTVPDEETAAAAVPDMQPPDVRPLSDAQPLPPDATNVSVDLAARDAVVSQEPSETEATLDTESMVTDVEPMPAYAAPLTAPALTRPQPIAAQMEPEEETYMDYPEGFYDPVTEGADNMSKPEGNDAVMSMSVISVPEDEQEWPTESYEPEPARPYVVSPPLAWAPAPEPLIEPKPEEQPLVARPRGAAREWGDLHGVIDATYVSRFIWRGYDVYRNNHSAFQPSVDLDLFGTGFGLNVWMSRANSSGFEDSEWLTYTAYYKGSLFTDEAYATYYKIGYTYFSYPDTPRAGNPLIPGTGDAQEIFGAFQWPNLLPGGIVPSYAAFAYWPSESGSTVRNNGGWAHVFGLSKDITFESILGNQPEQVLHLGAYTVYNDAVGPGAQAPAGTTDHDWSHAVFSVSTDFDLGKGFTFVPGFYYQSSWDDSVNTSDEYWTSLSLSYSF